MTATPTGLWIRRVILVTLLYSPSNNAYIVRVPTALQPIQKDQAFENRNTHCWSLTSSSSTTATSRSWMITKLPSRIARNTKSRKNRNFLAMVGDDSSENDEPLEEKHEMSSKEESGSDASVENQLDQWLSRCTSAFPLYVVLFSILGFVAPSSMKWVNQGNLVTLMLASVMCGTGLTLQPKDFENVVRQNWSSVPLGVACQFLIMPLTAWTVGRALLLTLPPSVTNVATAATISSSGGSSSSVGASLFLGLCLVGCSPGGTASNLVTLIAQANVALSVVLTACSTLCAVVVTPCLVQLLVQSHVRVSARDLWLPTAQVILLPVLVGMVLNAKAPKLSQWLSRFTPLASALLVGCICGGVVAQSVPLLSMSSTSSAASLILARAAVSVIGLHSVGFALGYIIPRWGFGKSRPTSRTMSIEVGMQNSVLAVVLARSIAGAPPLAQLPGALSATVHSCLGSFLATIWRSQIRKEQEKETNAALPETGESLP